MNDLELPSSSTMGTGRVEYLVIVGMKSIKYLPLDHYLDLLHTLRLNDKLKSPTHISPKLMVLRTTCWEEIMTGGTSSIQGWTDYETFVTEEVI